MGFLCTAALLFSAGLLLAHGIFFIRLVSKVAEGYFLQALRRSWVTLAITTILEVVLGTALVVLLLAKEGRDDYSQPTYLFILVVGIALGFVPSLVEVLLLNVVTPENAKSVGLRFARAIRWKYEAFRRGVQRALQQDNYDCVNCKGLWRELGHDTTKMGRVIRLIYSHHKVEIANERKDPRFLDWGAGVYPGNLFYLLAKFLGRERLKRLLREDPESPPPGHDWDGSERRRVKGTTGGRRRGPSSKHVRAIDDPGLVERVTLGKACGEHVDDRPDLPDEV